MHLLSGPVSHEQKLSQSLEVALTSTLVSMPYFSARLTRGQLQQLGTRESSASWRPGAASGNWGPICLSRAREQKPGPASGAPGTAMPSLLSTSSQHPGLRENSVSFLFQGELRGSCEV